MTVHAFGVSMPKVSRMLVVTAALAVTAFPAIAIGQSYQELFQKATTLKSEGEFARSEEILKKALRLQPNNADALFQLGQVQSFQDKFAEALSTLERGRSLAPDNIEFAIVIARVKYWQGRLSEARTEIDAVLTRAPQNHEALILKEQVAAALETRAAQTGWRLDVSYSNSSFGRSANDDWHEGTLTVQRRLSPQTSIKLGTLVSRRHAMTDTEIRIGAAHRFRPGLVGRAEAAATPSADFLPRWDVGLGASFRLHNGGATLGDTWSTGDIRIRRYAHGDVRNYDPGLEQYVFNGQVKLTGKWLHSHDVASDRRLNGWLGRVDLWPTDGLRIHMGRSLAPETDSGLTTEVYATFGGITADVTDSASIGINAARESRSGSYIRNEIVAVITVRY